MSKFIVFVATVQAAESVSQTVESAGPSGVAAGAAALGLDGRLLTAQIVNFVVVLLVLRHFVYRPLLNMLEERRRKIEEAEKRAIDITDRYNQLEQDEAKCLEQAKRESSAILEQAKAGADRLTDERMALAEQAAARLVAETKEQIARERESMITEAKKELGVIVLMATERLVRRKLDWETEKEMVEEAIKASR